MFGVSQYLDITVSQYHFITVSQYHSILMCGVQSDPTNEVTAIPRNPKLTPPPRHFATELLLQWLDIFLGFAQ
jgi:hypothetical protein